MSCEHKCVPYYGRGGLWDPGTPLAKVTASTPLRAIAEGALLYGEIHPMCEGCQRKWQRGPYAPEKRIADLRRFYAAELRR